MEHLKSFENFQNITNEGTKSALFRGVVDMSKLWGAAKKILKGDFKGAWENISDENHSKYKRIVSFFIDNRSLFENDDNHDRLFDEAKRNYNGDMSALFNDMYNGNIEDDCNSAIQSFEKDLKEKGENFDVKKRMRIRENIEALNLIKDLFT